MTNGKAPKFSFDDWIKACFIISMLWMVIFRAQLKAHGAEVVSPKPHWSVTAVSPQLEVWFRGFNGDQGRVAALIGANFEKLSAHPIFKGRLPKRLAVLVDGTWNKTAAYWANDLKAPSGAPAILLSPAVSPELVLDSVENMKQLTHEAAHLVHHSFRPHEANWVREGVALLAEYNVTGYFSAALAEGFATPETSLVEDLDPRHAEATTAHRVAQYGHLVQYFFYIQKLCGKTALFDALLTSEDARTGREFLDALLKASGKGSAACSGFEQSFERFELARFINEPGAPDRYLMHVAMRATVRPKAPKNIPAYSAVAYRLQPGKSECPSPDRAIGDGACLKLRFE